jgi:ribonuclease P protein component
VDTRRFVLVLSPGPTPDTTRLGITASRRIGNAVARNRAKRLVREAFRRTLARFPMGLDLVVIVKKPLGDLRLADVLKEWDGAFGAIERRARKLFEVARNGPSGKSA